MSPRTTRVRRVDTSLIERNRKVRTVLAVILGANWAVAVLKLALGLMSDSAAVTADGVHSFIDGGSNVLALVAMSFAAQPADAEHPYGHAKFEALASLGIGALIGVSMLELGRMALDSLVHDRHPSVTPLMVAVMVGTLLINLAVTWSEHRQGQKLQSPLLLADARHTLSDVWVTLAVLGSLGLVKLGYPKADGLVTLGVMVIVARVAWDIVKQAVGILSDTARLDTRKVSALTLQVPGVLSCRDVRSRGMEGTVYVDLKIEVAPEMSTARAHELADAVEAELQRAFPEIIDVVVHVEPAATPLLPSRP
jgi:cation diffusion facilitator family transporter